MDNTYKYPAIPPRQLDENSHIVGCDGEQLSTLTEYWKWAHSDLLGNTERGILAEYLVRLALNITSNRLSCDKYDLLYKERIRIEVKSSAYIQTCLAIAMPSRCLCRIVSRSSSASAANTVNMKRPCGVSVSTFSFRLMSPTPFSVSS